MTKSLGCEAVVSEEVLISAGLAADALPRQQVEIRGRREPMSVRVAASAKALSAQIEPPAKAAAELAQAATS